MHTNYLTQHQSHLWVSDSTTLTNQVIRQIQCLLCLKQGCKQCTLCKQIEQKQHAWISWIQPEDAYTLADIDQVIQSVRFKLYSNEKRFFIFTKAHELTPACSNRLLKTIEEPNFGYFFIFLANKSDDILPTLISRCFVMQFQTTQSTHHYQEIMDPFITSNYNNPVGFIKTLDKLNIKEQETKEIIDLLLQHFYTQLIQEQHKQDFNKSILLKITDKIIVLKQALLQLPLPGSSKMFWKNFYITLLHNRKSQHATLSQKY